MQHILMKQATRRPYSSVPDIDDSMRYDAQKGYWIAGQTPLVVTEGFLNGGHSTKKCDQETGEDQKGE